MTDQPTTADPKCERCDHGADRHVDIVHDKFRVDRDCHDCECEGYRPPTTEPAESEGMLSRAYAFYEEAEHFSCEGMVEFAQAEIERQTPAIIENVFDELEKEITRLRNKVQGYSERREHAYEAMQTVKARRSGGEE